MDANVQKSEFTHTKRELLAGRDDAKADDANIGNVGRVFIVSKLYTNNPKHRLRTPKTNLGVSYILHRF